MKAGNVLRRVAQLQLTEDVVTNSPSCAGGKRRNRAVGKMNAQAAQLPVLGTKFMSPLRNAVGLVNGEECNGEALHRTNVVSARQPFRRKVQEPVFTVARLSHHQRLLVVSQRTVQDG